MEFACVLFTGHQQHGSVLTVHGQTQGSSSCTREAGTPWSRPLPAGRCTLQPLHSVWTGEFSSHAQEAGPAGLGQQTQRQWIQCSMSKDDVIWWMAWTMGTSCPSHDFTGSVVLRGGYWCNGILAGTFQNGDFLLCCVQCAVCLVMYLEVTNGI